MRIQCRARTRLATRKVNDKRYLAGKKKAAKAYLDFLQDTIDTGSTARSKVEGLREMGAPPELLVEGEKMAREKWREAEAATVCRAIVGIGDDNKDGDLTIEETKRYLKGTAFWAFVAWWTQDRVSDESHKSVWSHFGLIHGGVDTRYDGIVDKQALFKGVTTYFAEEYAKDPDNTTSTIVSSMVQAAQVWRAAHEKRKAEEAEKKRIKANEAAAEYQQRRPGGKEEAKLLAKAMMAIGDSGKSDGELTETELRTYIGMPGSAFRPFVDWFTQDIFIDGQRTSKFKQVDKRGNGDGTIGKTEIVHAAKEWLDFCLLGDHLNPNLNHNLNPNNNTNTNVFWSQRRSRALKRAG